MKNLDLISEELFNKIRGRFPTVTIGNTEGVVTNDPKEARFFDFDYKEGPKSLGKISISVDESNLSVMYSNNFVEGQDEVTKNNWYDFLKELRFFAKKRLLNFDTRDITKSNLNKRDYKFLAKDSGEEKMTESKMYGTSRTSYQDIGTARLALKHNQAINQELASGRTQHVNAIYIESAEGERFKYPFKHLNGARAMARHVSEGGKTHDEFGKHITGLSEELYKLKKFKSYMNRSGVMAEGLAQYMDVVNERVLTVKKTVEGLQKEKVYKEAIENYAVKEVREVPEDVASNWIDQLTIKQFNEELKDVFPYIYNLVNETSKVQELSPENFNEDDAYFDYNKMAKDISSRYGDSMSIEDLEEWAGDNVDDPHMIEMDELARAVEEIGVDIHHSDDYDGQPSSYDEYQDLYGGDDYDHGQFDSFESWADDTVESALKDETIEEGYMKGYKKYHCKDCEDTMHMPTTKCGHDSHDEAGSWWRDENGNGVPDVMENKTPGDSHYNKERAMDMLKKKGITNPTYGELMAAIKQIEMGEADTNEDEQDFDRESVTWEELKPHVMLVQKKILMDIAELEKEIEQYRAGGDDGEEGGDIYEVMPYLRDLKDMLEYPKHILQNPAMDIETIVDHMMPAGLDTSVRESLIGRFKTVIGYKDPQLAKRLFMDPELDFYAQGKARDNALDGIKDSIEDTELDRIKELAGASTEEKQMPITEFVLSMYDRHTGQFPKGETAILTAIEKDYGEQYITPAKKFIEAINSKYEQMMTQEPKANTELDSILQLSGQKY